MLSTQLFHIRSLILVVWHLIGNNMIKGAIIMIVTKKVITEKEGEKDWEDPTNPEAPTDARDKEQIERMYEEAKRRNENLTDTDQNEQKN